MNQPDSSGGLRSWWRRPLSFMAGFGMLLLALVALGAPVYRSPEVSDDRAKLRKMARLDAIVLGNSHAASILPKEAGLNGLNFFHPGQDLFEMDYIVRRVWQVAPRLGRVLITLSYFTFEFDNAAYLKHGVQTRTGRRVALYSAFGPYGFIPGDGAEYAKGLLWPIVTADHWEARLLGARRDKRPRHAMQARDDDDQEQELGGAHGPQALRRCREYGGFAEDMRARHPHLQLDTFDLLLRLVRDLEKGGVEVILFTPPYTNAYNACFDGRLQALTRESAAKIVRLTHARYVDWSTHPKLSGRDEFFRDSDHVAVPHRPELSRALKAELARPSNR